MHWSSTLLLLWAGLTGLASSQNCPFIGPAYPPANNASSPAFISAAAAFDKLVAEALSIGQITANSTYFAVQVFSSTSKKPLYETYHTPTIRTAPNIPQMGTAKVGPDTIFRIHSLSKLWTVYTALAKLGDKYWDEPVTKFVPEFSGLQHGEDVRHIKWDEVTLGSLASLTSGLAKDYAFSDFSAGGRPQPPGFRPLTPEEVVHCGPDSGSPRDCTRAEAVQGILATYPWSKSFNNPQYSNMAFQIFAWAVANITGVAFPDLIRQQLLEPLNLQRSFLTLPPNGTDDLAIANGWDQDFGDYSPTAGYYSSAADVSTIGQSILASSLLPEITTRRWLRPLTHTSSLYTSLGQPWEIFRRHIPTNRAEGSKTTRIVDLYTKKGGGGPYNTLLALSPAHDLGITIMTAGPNAAAAFRLIEKASIDIWVSAGEQAARDVAGQTLTGKYSIPESNSTVEIILDRDEPGLYIRQLISNGTDIWALLKNILQDPRPEGFRGWLYPMGLSSSSSPSGNATSEITKTTKVAFRAAFGFLGTPAGEDCRSWAEGDRLRHGKYPGDLAIFELEPKSERVKSVQFPMLNEKAFKRVN